MIDQAPFGCTSDGRTVTLFTLSAGSVRIQVMDFGATLVRVLSPDAAGTVADIALGFDRLEGYLDNPACYGGTYPCPGPRPQTAPTEPRCPWETASFTSRKTTGRTSLTTSTPTLSAACTSASGTLTLTRRPTRYASPAASPTASWGSPETAPSRRPTRSARSQAARRSPSRTAARPMRPPM